MILPKDIFITTIEYVRFLLYLSKGKVFTVEELSSKFGISKWLLYKHVKYWEKQNYISLVSMIGKKGGKMYHYKATSKLEIQIQDILKILLKSKGIKEQNVEKLLKDNN